MNKVTEAGGQVLGEPMEIPGVGLALLADAGEGHFYLQSRRSVEPLSHAERRQPQNLNFAPS